MFYVLIKGGQYGSLEFEERESMGFELCAHIDLPGVNEVREGNC